MEAMHARQRTVERKQASWVERCSTYISRAATLKLKEVLQATHLHCCKMYLHGCFRQECVPFGKVV
jgi:hypothetical protein